MAAKNSAGFMMYRRAEKGIEIFLVHPGGPYFAKKDERFWSIPKGLIEDDESALGAAIREFEEETGIHPKGPFTPLGQITQKGGKVVTAWAFEKNIDSPIQIKSNLFEIEWPPHSGIRQKYPEIDRAGFFSVEMAKKKINSAQIEFINTLLDSIH